MWSCQPSEYGIAKADVESEHGLALDAFKACSRLNPGNPPITCLEGSGWALEDA